MSGGVSVAAAPESTRPTTFSTSSDAAGFVSTYEIPFDNASARASRSP